MICENGVTSDKKTQSTPPKTKPHLEPMPDGQWKQYELIKSGIDPKELLDEIASVEGAWDIQKGRQNKISVQREAKSIPIRGLRKSKIAGRERIDVHESRYTTTSRKLPLICNFLEKFAKEWDGELSRAKLVLLPPGHRVYAHIDRGEYYWVRDRFHLVLQTGDQGSWMRTADEEIRMKTGELWRFNNKGMHEALNEGEIDRIHFIFDLRPL
jgi:aspartyl/asparaginyl beta-hydroxylase